ncbi:hypothetical protein SSPO_033580 [Streptomyces antimycoticus]|uniref:Uncharacterized protein n=1 Tax=Streptomyces antimycoticus TaxID=68175 RepID=A0A499UJW7_9ACTN|nr:hypothetical protein SSPO_033580 [Streptomyces antimycoticus]
MVLAGPVEPRENRKAADGHRKTDRADGGGRRALALRLALMAVPLAFFAVFFAYPVAAIVTRGCASEGGGGSAGSPRW